MKPNYIIISGYKVRELSYIKETEKACLIEWREERHSSSFSRSFDVYSAWIPKSILFNDLNLDNRGIETCAYTELMSDKKKLQDKIADVEAFCIHTYNRALQSYERKGIEPVSFEEWAKEDNEQIAALKKGIQDIELQLNNVSIVGQETIVFSQPVWFNINWNNEVKTLSYLN